MILALFQKIDQTRLYVLSKKIQHSLQKGLASSPSRWVWSDLSSQTLFIWDYIYNMQELLTIGFFKRILFNQKRARHVIHCSPALPQSYHYSCNICLCILNIYIISARELDLFRHLCWSCWDDLHFLCEDTC